MAVVALLGGGEDTGRRVTDPRSLAVWSQLEQDAVRLSSTTILELFAGDSERVDTLTFQVGPLTADLSKHLWDAGTIADLARLAEAMGVPELLAELASGAIVNPSEGRAALHLAGRATPEALRAAPIAAFAETIRSSDVDAVVVLGTGGSHLGPALCVEALRRFHDGPEIRFATSLDSASFDAAFMGLNPETTLVVASSKSFRTLEMATNLEMARTWLGDATPNLAAVTSRPELAVAAGISDDRIFEIDDAVGGRFSVSSAIGLPVMLAVGIDVFVELLEGFAFIDEHLLEAPLQENLCVLLGLQRIWYSCFLGAEAAAVVPYARDLQLLPAHLQQLEMESLGKRVRSDGEAVTGPTGPIIFGGVGTDAQHAFFQMLHQGTHLVPVDLIGVLDDTGSSSSSHDLLFANLLAQAEVLAAGLAHQDPQRALPGNRPSTLLLLERLDARSLGALLGLYEHATVVEGWTHGLNPFDQWGVEVGKVVATAIAEELTTGASAGRDPSTRAAIERYRAHRS